MKILVLQLKRIGDLVLSAPVLAGLRGRFPGAQITLVVAEGCAGLLGAFGKTVDRALVFKKRSFNAALWKELFAGGYELCLDLTGNDRSALLTAVSRARQRVTFAGTRRNRLRALAYGRFVESAVRERHTAEHYLALLDGVDGADFLERLDHGGLCLPDDTRHAVSELLGTEPFIVIHPGTARPEKYWKAERWAALIGHLRKTHPELECVITGGPDAFERVHISRIQEALEGDLGGPCRDFSGELDLLKFAAVIERAWAVLSCDTAAVHLAAAFERPQIALFGVTNPFHWRPRHERAVVISAAHPEGPLVDFTPRMKGAPMAVISTRVVISATDALLAGPASCEIARVPGS